MRREITHIYAKKKCNIRIVNDIKQSLFTTKVVLHLLKDQPHEANTNFEGL